MRRWPARHVLAPLLAAASLAGCASSARRQRRLELRAAPRAARSRSTLGKSAAGSRSRPASARSKGSFRWQQRADALDLAVRGPLGAGVLQVNGSPNALTVTARGDTRVLDGSRSAALGAARLVAAGREPARVAARLTRSGFDAATKPGDDGTLAALDQRLVARRVSELSARDRRAASRRRSCRGASISRTASSGSGSRSTTGTRYNEGWGVAKR